MRHIIIHKSVYLLLCVVNLVFFDSFSSGFTIYHGLIALVVLVNLINLGRGVAGVNTYYVEMAHSWARIFMVGIAIILLSIFVLVGIFSTPSSSDDIGAIFVATLSLSPLVHIIWFPAVDIFMSDEYFGFAFFAGICIFFAFAEREFLRQLKRNQHRFLRPAEEVQANG